MKVEVQGVGTIDFPDDAKPDEISKVLNERYPAQQPGWPEKRAALVSEKDKAASSVNMEPLANAAYGAVESLTPHGLLSLPTRLVNAVSGSNYRDPNTSKPLVDFSGAIEGPARFVEQGLHLPPGAVVGPESPVSGVAQGLEEAASGFTAPETVAAAPALASPYGRMAVTADMLRAAQQQVEQSKEVMDNPDSTLSEKVKSFTAPAISMAMAGTVAAHGSAKALEPSGKIPVVYREIEKGEPNASSIEKTAEVHGDLQSQPEPSSGEVPTKESGAGIRPPKEAQKGEILLSKPDLSADELVNMRPDEMVTWKKNVSLGPEVEKTIAAKLTDEDVAKLELERDNLRAKATALNALMEKRGKVDDRTMRAAGEESVKAQTLNEILQEREALKKTPVESLPEGATKMGATETPPVSEPELVGMGGAIPKEFETSPQTPTSIKNAAVDVERQKRGLPPAIQAAKRSFGAVWDETMAKIDRDPGYQDRLVAELRDSPRALTDSEDAALLHRQIDLQNEYGKATRDLAQAYDDGRMDAVGDEKARVAALSDQLLDLYNVGKKVGTETGRGLNARKMMAYEDFSLAKMELEKRSANGGRPLTDSERTQITELQQRIEKTQKAYDDYVSKTDQRIAELELKRALDQVEKEAKQQPTIHPRILNEAERIVKIMEKSADAARARLREKFARASAGVDPTILGDLSIIGAAKIARGVVEFGKWSEAMLKDIGEGIQPYLKDAWEASNKQFDASIEKLSKAGTASQIKRAVKKADVSDQIKSATETIKERISAGQRSEITGQVQKLARLFVERGAKTRDELIDSVHSVLKTIDPNFTRRETMDAISGYGDFKQLTKDEISVKLRDLKGQMQQVAKLEDMQAKRPPLKTGIERRIPSQEESRLIKLVNDAKNQFQIPIDDPNTQLKSSLDTLKTRLKNARLEFEDKLARKDFAKKPKRIIQMDAEANRLHFENAKAKIAWHEALMKDRLANRSIPAKILGGIGEVLNTSRALMTSLDLSAVLRQGGFIALGHPVRALKSFPAMFRAFASEAGQHAVNQEILARKNYPLYNQSKLYLSEHGQKLSQMEEAYMSRWADKIPLVAGSQRAYVTFLNKLRADSFDAMANSLSRDGELTPKEANAISNFINVSTGRGNLGMKENALVGLNSVFFAPRYVASRFQLIAGQPLYRGTARTRLLVAKEYARFLIGIGTVYALAKMGGADVETDARSSDFGKIKIGNTRVDPLAGLAQSTVLLGRLATGETKNAAGKVTPIRGAKLPYGAPNSADVIARFLRTKLSPAIGTGVDVATGTDVVGNPVTTQSVATGLLVPLSIRDIYKTMLDQGVPAGTVLSLLSIFGMGVQTYDEKKKPAK